MSLKRPPQPRDTRAAEMAALQMQLETAMQLHRAGKLDEAARGYEAILKRVPDQPDALNLLGVVYSERRPSDFAIELISRASKLRPKDPLILNNLGKALSRSRRYEEAIEALERAHAIEPALSETLNNLIQAYRLAGYMDEARAAVAALRKARTDVPVADYEEARLLMDLGRKDEARVLLERLTAAHPQYGAGWLASARLDTVKPGDPLIGALHDKLAQAKEPSETHRFLCYALGKAYDDIGEYDLAFAHFSRAKAQETQTYDRERTEALFGSIKKTLDRPFLQSRREFGVRDERPVFIVGMPRSGTTLVEQILASHPDVHGGGELEHLGRFVAQIGDFLPQAGRAPEAFRQLSANTVAAVAFRYLRVLKALDPNAARVTDKMPHNFLWLGFVQMMLPDAKVIHCVRDPIDTCLSCYMLEFSQSHSYNKELKSLGHYYRLYQDLIQHWREVLDLPFSDVVYEDTIADQAEASRNILSAAGVVWDDTVMSFHLTERRVATPSNAQVRRPIYTSSSGRWRRYEKHLAPLIEALEETGPVV